MRTLRSSRTIRGALVLLTALTLVCSAGGPISAAVAGTPITAEVNATGAIVTGGGQPPRTLDSDQAAAFSQAWLAIAFYATPTIEEPPAGTPTYLVTTSYVTSDQQGENRINVATDGASIWLSLPAQLVFLGISVAEDQADIWFQGSPTVLQAFNGDLRPEPVENSLVDPETDPVPAAETSDSDSSPVLLIIVILVAAAVIIGGVILGTRRRGTSA